MQFYKGDLLPKQAWEMLMNDDKSFLIDVRTILECHYVGQPYLNKFANKLITLEWRQAPNMELNENFGKLISKVIPNKESKLIFLCSRGGRSMEAAKYMTDAGYECYNILHGFDGDIDNQGHRGATNGWKADKLAWRQE